MVMHNRVRAGSVYRTTYFRVAQAIGLLDQAIFLKWLGSKLA